MNLSTNTDLSQSLERIITIASASVIAGNILECTSEDKIIHIFAKIFQSFSEISLPLKATFLADSFGLVIPVDLLVTGTSITWAVVPTMPLIFYLSEKDSIENKETIVMLQKVHSIAIRVLNIVSAGIALVWFARQRTLLNAASLLSCASLISSAYMLLRRTDQI